MFLKANDPSIRKFLFDFSLFVALIQFKTVKMKLRSLLLLLCVSEVFQQGGTALIETQQFVTVEIGEDAHLSCRLVETKYVVEVVWLQLSPHPGRFLAEYSKNFGETVNPDLRGKMAFTRAALHSSTIVIRNVTDQDEGCYQCVFNTYPEGSFRNKTCLQVYVTPSVLPQDPQLSTGLSGSQVTVIVVDVLIVLVCVCAAVLLIKWWLKRNRGNRNSENDGTPQNSTPPTQGTETPLLQHENERLIQQESLTNNQEKDATDAKTSKATAAAV